MHLKISGQVKFRYNMELVVSAMQGTWHIAHYLVSDPSPAFSHRLVCYYLGSSNFLILVQLNSEFSRNIGDFCSGTAAGELGLELWISHSLGP